MTISVAMLETGKERGFAPQGAVSDSWDSSLDNLKLMRQYGWLWLSRLKRNRHVNGLLPGISCYEAKLALLRDAIRAYLAAPRFSLTPTA